MSIKVDPEGSDNLTRADGSTVAEATGWSGDGAPGRGSLREFAIGAITQHFPKTLNRIEGQDFRLPTDAELDALEAFQLSLGRQVELDLATMDFDDPDVQMGKDLFNGVGINRACSNCHNNAGANNSDGFNNNFGTNAASLLNTPARQFDPAIPGDGGFDSGPEFEIAGIGAKFYGNGSMNSASLVDAADTGPFFHNNSAATIEDAVRFYTTATFSDDNAFQLDDAQINQVAAFLRMINTLGNARNAIVLAEDAQREPAERARDNRGRDRRHRGCNRGHGRRRARASRCGRDRRPRGCARPGRGRARCRGPRRAQRITPASDRSPERHPGSDPAVR
jgi:hypothetical protein